MVFLCFFPDVSVGLVVCSFCVLFVVVSKPNSGPRRSVLVCFFVLAVLSDTTNPSVLSWDF